MIRKLGFGHFSNDLKLFFPSKRQSAMNIADMKLNGINSEYKLITRRKKLFSDQSRQKNLLFCFN